ncbi:MAG TPA: DciA family protein [Bauldia sp.]|nr:DciA family protein [Bauldia sp.]
MTEAHPARKRKGPLPLGEIVGRVIEPVTARRGFAKADLIAAWPEIAGPLHASCTAPERIVWPRRGDGDEPPAGTLFIRADGPRAVFVQHELPQIVERVNAFFGYRAVAQARIVQGPVDARMPGATVAEAVDPAADARVASTVAAIEDDSLRTALHRLGRGVFTKRRD